MTATAGETVTHTSVRIIDLPGGAGPFALLTIDNGSRRPVTFGPQGLTGLSEAIDEATRAGALAIGVTGRPGLFCAGADLTFLAEAATREEVLEVAQLGHRVFGRLAALDVPSFAFIDGVALGGGLELALHCTYRTVAATAGPLGLPEVGLGLVPGWGGTWLLPRLTGVDGAVDVIVAAPLSGGRTMTGSQLAALGVADELIESSNFLGASLRWAEEVLGGAAVDRPEIDFDADRWQAAIDRGIAVADARVHRAAPAAYRALELLAGARTADQTAGFAAEDDALADLALTDESRAAMYALRLTQSRAKYPADAPPATAACEVRRVGVVGAGLMASQLALLFATRLRVPVVMCDVDQPRVDKGLAWIADQLAGLHSKGRLSAQDEQWLRASITGAVDKSALSEADFVIEAIFEDLGVKQAMLKELEPLLQPECVIATNTSSLSLAAMADGLHRPQRFVGMHFFNPVSRMPLLEIVPAAATDDTTLATALSVGQRLGKSCVLVRDAPGFVVNRLLSRMFVELLKTVDEGTPLLVADRALDGLGLPMSPFALLALIGPGVQLHINQTLADVWPDRFPVSANLQAAVAAGVRSFVSADVPPAVRSAARDVLVQGDQPATSDEVRRRVRDALADETRRLLTEGVVASAADVDACMLLGAGWPAHLGGITPWLDRTAAATDRSPRFVAAGVASVPPLTT